MDTKYAFISQDSFSYFVHSSLSEDCKKRRGSLFYQFYSRIYDEEATAAPIMPSSGRSVSLPRALNNTAEVEITSLRLSRPVALIAEDLIVLPISM